MPKLDVSESRSPSPEDAREPSVNGSERVVTPEDTGTNDVKNEDDEKVDDIQEGAEEDAEKPGSGDDDEPEEYEVERILGHEWLDVGLRYVVKWKGYPMSQNTFEPKENLVAAKEILEKYHAKIGGPPRKGPALKSKRSARSLREEQQEEILEKPSGTPPKKRAKRGKKEDDIDVEFGGWVPRAENWEKEISEIRTVVRDGPNLYIYIVFRNGRKSKVKNEVVHKHCPHAMLRFYEAHLSV